MFIHLSLVPVAGIAYLWGMWWLDCSNQSNIKQRSSCFANSHICVIISASEVQTATGAVGTVGRSTGQICKHQLPVHFTKNKRLTDKGGETVIKEGIRREGERKEKSIEVGMERENVHVTLT